MQVIIQENGRIIQTLGIMEFPAYVRKFYAVPGEVLDTPHDLVDFFNEKSTACTAVLVEDGQEQITTGYQDAHSGTPCPPADSIVLPLEDES